ncbi:4-phosphoerythronate dehydrogenase [Microbulbifer yueqingensis]|uniref:Erythronate-4-phosphate dehydrogenase n=1 Tax=Microbulbifer yueqingensis TaxID=658219 RepID=A0A1G9AT25_9GAMM|nr:4-phosphoerythronate dehydrogenase [Microbulbifer yueqingensis]SDK29735.1 4-phosphoerythronate dehydrogenase [Microbulbifer yueqingensis]
MSERPLSIVADENIPAVEECFGDLGEITRVAGRNLKASQLVGADILLVRSVTEVNGELLSGSPVRFVGSCTIGTDHLDIDWMEKHGVAWSAAPGCNANSVVEYVFCALAALGVDWRRRSFGIVGCGNVGGLLQRRLHSLDIECAVYDPWLPDNPDSASLHTVLERDVVCLHAPLVGGGPHPSHHLLGPDEIALLRDDAVLVSAGRGAVVDNRALRARLQDGDGPATVLDVWENEPDIDLDLLQLVDIGTPHIAGYSMDGKLAGTRMVRAALDRFLGSSAPDEATADGAPALPLSTEGQGFAAMAGLLLQAYDPRADDLRLRAAAERAAAGSEPMAQGFDRLRKEYPERLEFSHFHIQDAGLGEAERRQLAVLGLL